MGDEDSATHREMSSAVEGEGGPKGGLSSSSSSSSPPPPSPPAVRGGCLTYCEVTGAPKLAFPLSSSAASETNSAEACSPVLGGGGARIGGEGAQRRSVPAGEERGAGEGGASNDVAEGAARRACRALKALNAFVCGLASGRESVEDAEGAGRSGGGAAPYTIQGEE